MNVWRIIKTTWTIWSTILARPTAKDSLNEIPPDALPPNPPPPPQQTPVKTAPPKPSLPPVPHRPVTKPIPAPTGTPFPTIPPRKLPRPTPSSGQKSVTVASEVSFTLASRVYGCMLYVPISSYNLQIDVCDSSTVYSEISNGLDGSVQGFIAWLLAKGNIVLDELEQYPVLKDLLTDVGLGEGFESFLANRFCQLAFAGLNLASRGGTTGVTSNPVIIAGCEALAKLALSYATRNYAVMRSVPVTTHGYTSITVVPCPPTDAPPMPDDIPDGITFNPPVNTDSCSPVLMPDSSAFMNAGKYLVIYWVLASDPNYKTYVVTWQVPDPIPAIWDVVDAEGKIIADKASGVWGTYFSSLSRVQGYQSARYYAEGRSKPVLQGHFDSKSGAEETFTKIIAMTNLTPRSKAPIVYGSSEKKDYLKELSHEGETLIVKKAVVIDKKPWQDNARCVITYTAVKSY